MPEIKKTLKGIVIFLFMLLIWEAAVKLHIWSEFVLPSPIKVFDSLIKMISSGELIKHLLISIRRVAIGFSISCAVTFILTSVSALFPKAVPYYDSLLGVIRHIPPISLIPLFILWFGIGETPKIIIIVLASLFPVLINTENGIFGCDRDLCDVGRMMGLSKSKIFFKIMLPNAVPSILVGIKIGLGYAWRAIVGAEMVAALSGLGYFILDAQTLSRTDKVLAGIMVIGFVGLVTETLCSVIERKVCARYGKDAT